MAPHQALTSPPNPATSGFGYIDQARRGDEQAWFRIVTDLGPVIRGLSVAKGVDDPDDLTQDVFVAVAKQLPRFKGDEAAFRTWVFSIAYRQIVNRWRRRSKQSSQLPADLQTTQRGPEEETIATTVATEAISALDVLNDTERDIVILSVITELSSDEIAEVTGKSAGNVRVIKTRALEQLRRTLRSRGYAELAPVQRKAG